MKTKQIIINIAAVVGGVAFLVSDTHRTIIAYVWSALTTLIEGGV